MKFIMITLLLLTGIMTRGQNKSLTVISNPVGSPSQMKLPELKSIFKAEKLRWSDGSKIQIALMKTNTEIGGYVSEKIYNMSRDDVLKFWLTLAYRGHLEPAKFFNTVNELQGFVSENPGAIGIIDQTPPISGVRMVLIDGTKSF